jgi:hypothetical protein
MNTAPAHLHILLRSSSQGLAVLQHGCALLSILRVQQPADESRVMVRQVHANCGSRPTHRQVLLSCFSQ